MIKNYILLIFVSLSIISCRLDFYENVDGSYSYKLYSNKPLTRTTISKNYIWPSNTQQVSVINCIDKYYSWNNVFNSWNNVFRYSPFSYDFNNSLLKRVRCYYEIELEAKDPIKYRHSVTQETIHISEELFKEASNQGVINYLLPKKPNLKILVG